MLTTIDTQDVYKTLISGGFTEEQADTVVKVIRKVDLSHLVTKDDLKHATIELKGEIVLLKWMLGFLVAGVGSLIANTFF